MTIIDKGFLLFYLPLGLAVYWLALRQPRLKLWFLAAASLAFYSFAGWQYVALLVGLSLATYALARRGWTGAGIVLNLLALGLFKYIGFGFEALRAIGLGKLGFFYAALPLGLSYFVFKHIGYLLDVRKGRYPATKDFVAFLTFSAFFPQISAGPISSFDDTGEQLRNLPAKLSTEAAYQGLIHLAVGLGKKLLIAEQLLPLLGAYSPGDGWGPVAVYILSWAAYIYMDFSGYTDTALGLGYLFGVTLPPNFDNPFLAPSPPKFWERWHVSLSRWFRVYVFTPLSRWMMRQWGSQRRELAQYAANIVTMVLVGVWHGATWGFVLWGLFYGMLLNIHAWLNRKNPKLASSSVYSAVFMVVVVSGVLTFIAPDLQVLRWNYEDLFFLHGFGDLGAVWASVTPNVLMTLALAIFIALSGNGEAKDIANIRSPWVAALAGLALILILSMLGSPSDFAYAQF